MDLIERVSNEEVLAEILYLDPDLSDGKNIDQSEETEIRSTPLAEVACVVLSIGILAWIPAMKYLPIAWQFLSQRLGPELFR